MRMILLSALLALGLGFAATTGASAAGVLGAAGLSAAADSTSLVEQARVRCRNVRVCRIGPYGRRCRVERVCRRW